MFAIVDLISRIKMRPEMYFGRKSLELLYAFVCGYTVCKIEEDPYFAITDEFQTFVANKYGVKDTRNWANIIRGFSKNDEEAFDKFYCLFDEYVTGDGSV